MNLTLLFTPLLVATRVIDPPNSPKPKNQPAKPPNKLQPKRNQKIGKPLMVAPLIHKIIFPTNSKAIFKISIITP